MVSAILDELKTGLGHKPLRLIILPFHMVGNFEAVLRKRL